MKRSKLLALTLVVAIMMMGAGYAAWTDVLKLNTTINTGELEISLEQPIVSSVNVKELTPDGVRAANAEDNIIVTAPDINLESKTVTFEFENLFPGTQAYTTFWARNTGTMPVAINAIDLSWETKDDGPDNIESLANAITVQYYIAVRNTTHGMVEKVAGGSCELSGLEDEINGKINGQIILPGYELVFGDDSQTTTNQFIFHIDRDNTLFGDKGELETVEVKIALDFVQPNMYVPN